MEVKSLRFKNVQIHRKGKISSPMDFGILGAKIHSCCLPHASHFELEFQFSRAFVSFINIV